jgi:hypothetical protein
MSAEAFSYSDTTSFSPSINSSVSEFKSSFYKVHPINNLEFDNRNPDFNSDLSNIRILQEKFNKELGITKQDRLNYNPVLARWKFENISKPADIEQFKKYELWQIQTALYERNQVEKNSVNYTIGQNGEIYNELFPDEPFRNVLLRGIAYQKEHRTVEPEREQAEFDGWEKICSLLKNPNTPANTKAIVISPPGIAANSKYLHNFIDNYEALDDPVTKKRFIKMTRYTSSLDYEQYKTIAEYFDPDYFNNAAGPVDAWHLENPIYRNPMEDARTVDEIMEHDFGIFRNIMVDENKQAAWEQVKEVAKHFLEEGICKDNFDPKVIAAKWNALLAKNDLIWNVVRNRKDQNETIKVNKKHFDTIHDEIEWLSTQEVQTIAAACGASAGFNLNNSSKLGSESPINSIMKNSVAQFGLDKDTMGPLEFDCPKCQGKNVRPYGKLIEKCQNCGSTEVACKNDKAEASVTKVIKKVSEEKPKETSGRIFLFPKKDEPKKRTAPR